MEIADNDAFRDAVNQWYSLKKSRRYGDAVDHFFEQLLPTVVQNLSRRYEHTLRGRCKTLVSSLGFSPELTVIMATVFRPETLFVVYSENTGAEFSRCCRFLSEGADWKLQPHEIRQIIVEPYNPESVYEEVRRKLLRVNPAETVFDATGGTRIMTGICIQLAWELGASVYYSFGDYDPELKQPIPGTEEVKELPNPSFRIGLDRRQAAIGLYNQQNFRAAKNAFEGSATWNRDHLFEDFAIALCAIYGDWTDVNLTSLETQLDRFDSLRGLPLFGPVFCATRDRAESFDAHVSAHRRVARGDELALIATYLELAGMYRTQHRHDFSGLFSYRCMEACVHFGLKRVASQRGTTFDPNQAKYEGRLCDDKDDLLARYQHLSEQAGFGRDVTLPWRVRFMDGLGILCLVTEISGTPIHRNILDSDSAVKVIEHVKPVADLRNKSAMVHGCGNLDAADSERLLSFAQIIGQAILESQFDEIRELRTNLRPLKLEDFAQNQ